VTARLCLGTAAFGGHDRSRYGLNSRRAPTPSEITEILRAAQLRGLALDTAAAYGRAEELTGRCLSAGVSVTTKLLPLLSSHSGHLTRLVESEIIASRSRLRMNDQSILGVLFHSPEQGAQREMVAALRAARDAGLCQYIGTSIYFPHEFDVLVEGQDIVQLPYSIIDRRFAEARVFQRAHDMGMTVYARAPFCQGLVIMDPASVPERLAHARSYVGTFRGICREHGISPVEAALRFALEAPVDYVVFGVDDMAQLDEDLAIAASAPSSGWLALKESLVSALRDLPDSVVVPSLWAT